MERIRFSVKGRSLEGADASMWIGGNTGGISASILGSQPDEPTVGFNPIFEKGY